MCIKKKLKLIKRYGLYGGLRLLKDIFLTKFLFCSNVRIIRFPCYIRKMEVLVLEKVLHQV